MHSRSKISGPAMLLASGVLFATITLFVTFLTREGVGVWVQLAARLAFSILMLLLLLWAFSRDSLRIGGRGNLKFLVQNGLLMLSAFGTYVFSIALGTPPPKAILLVYLSPMYVALAGTVLLGEQLTAKKLMLLAVSLGGLCLTLEVWNIAGLASFQLGDLLALLNGVLIAAMTVVGRWSGIRQQVKPITLTFWSLVFALGWLVIFGLIALVWLGPAELALQWPGSASPRIVAYLVGLALLGTVLPYTLMYVGLQRTAAGIGSMVMLSEPICVFIGSSIFLQEPVGWWQIVGGVLVLGAGALVAR